MSALLKTEKRAMLSLSLIYAFRMLGLFMILPVFSLYASQYAGATPLLVGLAIGIYGLTQALFQIPFGFLSDRFGRKKMIVSGLLLFVAGSVVAALANSIEGVIIGRGLQGMGAIAAVVMALAADLTREHIRIRIMAVIGMSIGVAFMLSMIIGPVLAASLGISGIFWITALLALASILMVLFLTPSPVEQSFHRDAQLSLGDISRVLANRELLRLDLGVFILHMTLAATFVIFPLVMRDQLQLAVGEHWKTYLPVFVLSIILMVPLIITAERKRRLKSMFLVGIGMVILAESGLYLFDQYWWMFVALVVFFGGFNFLEATLPSLVAKSAPPDMKGTAMGVFSASQFFGAFCGGLLGGSALAESNYQAAFLQVAWLPVIWFVVAMFMARPKSLVSRIVSLRDMDDSSLSAFSQDVRALPGVKEVAIYIEDRVAYLKVDKRDFDDQLLDRLIS
jgi:MFS family permease